MFQPLSQEQEALAKEIVSIAFDIHTQLGPGLLESVYETCFCHELKYRGIAFEQQKKIPILYNDLKIDDGLRLDLLVENTIIIELKAQENFHPVWEAQLLSYLKLTRNRLGFIINFHVPLIKKALNELYFNLRAPLCHCALVVQKETYERSE